MAEAIRVTKTEVQRVRVADYWRQSDGTLCRTVYEGTADPISEHGIPAVRVMFPDHMTGADATRQALRWLHDNVTAGLSVGIDKLEKRTGFQAKTIENHISKLVARKEARRVGPGSFLPLFPLTP